MSPSLVIERRGSAAWIRLNRPAVMNSLDPEMVRSLAESLAELEADESVRAIAVTGEGPAFCAGADLDFAGQSGDEAVIDDFLIDLHEALLLLESVGKPTIAAVNGVAVAGGFELVLCCDMVVASTTARLGDGHAKYGIIPGGGASGRLPRKIPSNAAKHLMFTGALLDAAEFVRLGLVQEIVEPSQLETTVDALMDDLAARSPLGVRRMKHLLNDAIDMPLKDALRAELVSSEAHRRSYDNREGVAAFREKRAPRFKGI